jgi:hypothetical protein
MFFSGKPGVLFLLSFIFCLTSCKNQNQIRPNNEMPPKILWAWERAEDLRFVDTDQFGVAFLAQTLFLQNEEIIYKPRRQPLEIAPGTYLIAVTRIETSKEGGKRPTFSSSQVEKIVALVKNTLERPNVRAVQIDYDAVGSERKFYRELMTKLKNRLPGDTPLTMTALASWCAGDAWFNDFPVDEAVPMAFEMGADDDRVRSFLAAGNDWREPLCKGSYGISVDEPLNVDFKPNRRFYYFKSKAWEKSDIPKIRQ